MMFCLLGRSQFNYILWAILILFLFFTANFGCGRKLRTMMSNPLIPAKISGPIRFRSPQCLRRPYSLDIPPLLPQILNQFLYTSLINNSRLITDRTPIISLFEILKFFPKLGTSKIMNCCTIDTWIMLT